MSRTIVMSLLRRYRFLLLLVLAILFLLATGILPPNIGAIGLGFIVISVCVLELRRHLSNKLVRVALLIALIASWGYALVLAFLLFMSGGVVYPGATFAGTWVDSYGLHLRYKVSVDDTQPYDYYQNQIAKIYLTARYWPNITTQPEISCEFPNDFQSSTQCTFQTTNTTFGTSPAQQTGAPVYLITVQTPFWSVITDKIEQPYWMLTMSFSDNVQPDLSRDGTLIQIDRILIQPDQPLNVIFIGILLIAGSLFITRIPISDLIRWSRLAIIPLSAVLLLMALVMMPVSLGLISLLLIISTAIILYLRRSVRAALTRHAILAGVIVGWGYIGITAFLLFMSGGITYPDAISTTRWIDSAGLHVRYRVSDNRQQVFGDVEKQVNAIYLNSPSWPYPEEVPRNEENGFECPGTIPESNYHGCSFYGSYVGFEFAATTTYTLKMLPIEFIKAYVPLIGLVKGKSYHYYQLVQPYVYWLTSITITADPSSGGTFIQIDRSLAHNPFPLLTAAD